MWHPFIDSWNDGNGSVYGMIGNRNKLRFAQK